MSLALGLLFSAGCGEKKESGVTGQDVKKEAREAVQTATAFTQQQKEEYQKKLEAKLKEYDQKLDKLLTPPP